MRALVECDSLGQAHIKELLEWQGGHNLKLPQVTIRDNVLTATAATDSMSIYLTLKDRYTEHTTRDEQIVTRTVEVNRLTWWQTLWYRLGQILGAVGALCAGWKLYKLITIKR